MPRDLIQNGLDFATTAASSLTIYRRPFAPSSSLRLAETSNASLRLHESGVVVVDQRALALPCVVMERSDDSPVAGRAQTAGGESAIATNAIVGYPCTLKKFVTWRRGHVDPRQSRLRHSACKSSNSSSHGARDWPVRLRSLTETFAVHVPLMYELSLRSLQMMPNAFAAARGLVGPMYTPARMFEPALVSVSSIVALCVSTATPARANGSSVVNPRFHMLAYVFGAAVRAVTRDLRNPHITDTRRLAQRLGKTPGPLSS
jgi:hypothetical protein